MTSQWAERSARPAPPERPWHFNAFVLIAGALALMWAIEFVDTFITNNWFQKGGIHPRRSDGLDGILWAPWLHSDWAHIASNSVPFAVLGGLVAIRGLRRWLAVTIIVVVVGGVLTWLFARGGNHIGASGVVFGYFGALIGAAIFERKPATAAAALVAILMYSGIIVGIVPRTGISWEGHLFGAIAGLMASKMLAEERKSERSDELDPAFDWPDFDAS